MHVKSLPLSSHRVSPEGSRDTHLHWHSRGSVSYIRQEDSRIDPLIDVLVDDHLSHGAAKPSLLVQLLVVWFQDQGTSNLSMKGYIQSS